MTCLSVIFSAKMDNSNVFSCIILHLPGFCPHTQSICIFLKFPCVLSTTYLPIYLCVLSNFRNNTVRAFIQFHFHKAYEAVVPETNPAAHHSLHLADQQKDLFMPSLCFCRPARRLFMPIYHLLHYKLSFTALTFYCGTLSNSFWKSKYRISTNFLYIHSAHYVFRGHQ